MGVRRLVLAAMAVVLSRLACLGGETGALVLDETAYWRHYIQFGPEQLDAAALKAEGQNLLGEAGLERLRRKVLRYLQPPFAPAGEAPDPGKIDWREHARMKAVEEGQLERYMSWSTY